MREALSLLSNHAPKDFVLFSTVYESLEKKEHFTKMKSPRETSKDNKFLELSMAHAQVGSLSALPGWTQPLLLECIKQKPL